MATASASPGVGSHAPEIEVPDVAARACRGGPRVLAFVHDGIRGERPARLAAIRAELRGLGAELVVMSPAGVWWVGADDPLEPLAAASDELAAGVARAAACYGAADDDAVFVIDGCGVIRFGHRIARGGVAVWSALADALAIAGKALSARAHDARQRVLFTRREWTVTCLVLGCATAFLAGCKEQGRPAERRRAPPEETTPDIDVTLTVNRK